MLANMDEEEEEGELIGIDFTKDEWPLNKVYNFYSVDFLA